MEDRSSTKSFSNLQHHRHGPYFPHTLPNFQNSDVVYQPSETAQESLEQYGSRGEESTVSFLTSNTSSGSRRGSSGGDRVFLSTSASSLDGDASLGGHLDGDNRLGSHFDDSWYGKKEVWEDGGSCKSPADDFHGKGDCYGNTNDVFYAMNCVTEEGDRSKIRGNYNNYTHVTCEAKSETVYNREANMSHFTRQTVSFHKGNAGSYNDKSVDCCRVNSRVSDGFLGGEEDYGSSCGSGEDQHQLAEAEGSWHSVSPTNQADGRWRGAADTHTLVSGFPPQRSPMGISSRTYTQKLDSFSEAFLSQRKRRFPSIPSGDSSAQIWEFGVGRGEPPGLAKSRQSCVFDSDSHLPPSSSSSSSPAYLSLTSFPSPPTSSHLMPSVLSPPPTPLPPPSHSPSKMDSPSAQGGAGHSSQGGDAIVGLQFFPSPIQSLPSVHSSGMIWKFPILSHCFPQLSGDAGSTECNLRSSRGDDYGNLTAPYEIPQSPESSSLHSSRAVCPSSSPSFNSSFHLPLRPSHISGKHHVAAEKIAPYKFTQKVKNEPASVIQSRLQQQVTPVYTGTPFPSVLHSKRPQSRGSYTPQPLLNPLRRGTGLYSSLSMPHHREDETTWRQEAEECDELPYVNVGADFQADLPPCFLDREWSGLWFPDEESPREELLWKPWDELQKSAHAQYQVEKLLSMCSSSCLPGGGSNTELALHCLHHCQGNTMATLEMLLFSQPLPTGDYHYSGCDFWTDTEKNLFGVALETHGKDFSFIEKTVRTKTVTQCVEFYYLSKKLVDKQKKQKADECRDGQLELQKNVTPICQPVERQFSLEEVVPVPSLASFFPCKLCGKMFYKIKSRNAHMKIHRQPQEDWSERRLQHQLLTQRMALSRPSNLMPSPGTNLLPPQASALTFSSSGLSSSSNGSADSIHNSVTNSNSITQGNASILDPTNAVAYSNIIPPTSHIITVNNIDGGDSGQRELTTVLPFHQSWGSFGQLPDLSAFYCIPEGKEEVGAEAMEGKEPITWQ
ncbi:uncharacterized protein PAE49_021113 isoform 1-T2 [Odontesthes bonariensis]|uniref:uncharacterized protein LOC142369205 isoform X1 n=1 Tax=Odontesthes bonariensis TaxID=219752 RepID=UPI003F586FB5